jgi:hypothetical protein
MEEAIFLDSSVLLNILDVPGKNNKRPTVLPRFQALCGSGSHLLVIPMAAVLEVGNHIAQISDGAVRRLLAERLVTFLRMSMQGAPPWVVSGAVWDTAFLHDLVEGSPPRPNLVELATQGIGAGDASILLEAQRYRERVDLPSGLPLQIWSLDEGLQSYA